jgi:hypothetical protein
VLSQKFYDWKINSTNYSLNVLFSFDPTPHPDPDWAIILGPIRIHNPACNITAYCHKDEAAGMAARGSTTILLSRSLIKIFTFSKFTRYKLWKRSRSRIIYANYAAQRRINVHTLVPTIAPTDTVRVSRLNWPHMDIDGASNTCNSAPLTLKVARSIPPILWSVLINQH